jgi:formate hydrogenlyase subunit 4
MSVLLMLLQALVILLLAPFVNGVIKNLKGKLQSRRGPGILQVYRDLFKYLKKDSVVSPTTSWVFTIAPFVYFAGALGAAALVPTVLSGDGVFHFGNLFALCYLLALGRFFLALASLDAGSTFGGMGGSRELFLSVLVEPVMMITLAVVAFQAHSTDAAVIARSAAASGVTISGILAAIAFMILTITETGRIPVDNPDTHLELTMLHEAMTLEYSGRSVALIFWASAVKQLVFILLMVNLFLPWGPAGVIAMCVKALVVAVALAAIETGTNKMRLFRLPAFLMFTGILALMAIIAL